VRFEPVFMDLDRQRSE